MNSSSGHAAAHEDRDLGFEIFLRVGVAIGFGQLHGDAHRPAARNDGDLVQRIRLGQQRRDDGVAGFVVGAIHAIQLAERNRSAFDSHQHLVARLVHVGVGHHGAAGAAGEQRRLVHQVRQIGPGEAGCAARDRSQVHGRIDVDLARVDAQDGLAPAEVRVADGDLTIEPAGPEQRRVEDVLPVGRGDDDDPLVALEAVHFDQQLIQRLFALLVAQRVAAAAAAHGIELVDEDDAGAVTLRVAKQLAHPRCAHAGVHLHEVGAAGEQERDSGFPGNRAGEQRFPGSGRADEQDALGNPSAHGREPSGLAEKVHDFLDLVLCLVHSRHVLEGDDVRGAIGQAGPGPDSTGSSRRWSGTR